MKWSLFRFPPWRAKTPDPPSVDEVIRIAKEIESVIEGLVNSVFTRHYHTLMSRNITYIVPAVWGATKQESLGQEQKEIHGRVAPAVAEAVRLLGIRGMTPAQEFAIGYIIRGQIVSKMVYMIEAAKRLRVEEERAEAESGPAGPLDDMEPVGRA